MNSTRAAYKAKLREGSSSIVNRRKSRGLERKNIRDDELSKRRNLSNDMSPVVEMRESITISQTRAKKGSSREVKANNVVERLKQWREEKKRRQDQEKLNAKSKPMFKVGAMVRDSEAELFKRNRIKSHDERPKEIEKKIQPPKTQVTKPKEPAPATTRTTRPHRTTKLTADVAPKFTAIEKAPCSKKQPAKQKPVLSVTSVPKLQKGVDLASKLTAAAAAKRNLNASPKKFLRRTRATTLQKKDQVDNKSGAKNLKASSKSTGNLLANNVDLEPKSLKASLQSTGHLLSKNIDFDDETEMSSEQEFTSLHSDDNLMESASINNSVIPNEVPKILTDFNFSAMASSNDSTGDSKAESSDNMENFSFAGLKLKPKRKSTRRSTRLSALCLDAVESKNSTENFSDDFLISFTPGSSKRKSMRKSKGISLVQPVIETMEEEGSEQVTHLQILDTPKSAERKNLRKSIRLDSLFTEPSPLAQGADNLIVTFTPTKSTRRKSVRRSIRLASENLAGSEAKATPQSVKRKSMRKSTRLTAQSIEIDADAAAIDLEVRMSSPSISKSGRKSSSRKSKVLGSTASKQFDDLHISDPDESPRKSHIAGTEIKSCKLTPRSNNREVCASVDSGVATTPISSSRKKNVRKSLSLQAALALVQSDSDDLLNSGIDMSQEDAMEVDLAQHIVSDIDTQVTLVDATSTPKILASAQQKRKSLRNSMMESSIMDNSREQQPVSSSKKPRRSRRSTRRSSVLTPRSRRSLATPNLRSMADATGDADLDISNISTPNSVRNIENIPRRRSTVISVSDEGTAVGRELEPALAYKVEKVNPSARASRILNELVIEKVDGEKSFFEVSLDESMKGTASRNNSINLSKSRTGSPMGMKKTPQSNTTSPFTPRKSNEVTTFSSSTSSSPLTTPKSALRTRHSVAPSSGFKEPGLPLSAIRPAGSLRRKTYCTPKSKTPEQMISILKKSPMVEMKRRRSRHVSSPAVPKGQYFRDLITNETERLMSLSNKWNDIAASEVGLHEEVLGQIRSTVGKALLLIEQRFKQFSGLVDNYVYNLGEKETTPTDLQGFWDMIYFQVEDVNNQFKELKELQQSGWQVKPKTPKASTLNLKKKITKGKPIVKGVKSNFAAFRAELQKKKAAKASLKDAEQVINEMFVV